MQDLLTTTLETIAIAYSFCLAVQFIGAIPDMQRRKYEQLSLFDEFLSEPIAVADTAEPTEKIASLVNQTDELWTKFNDAPSHPAAPISEDVIVPFRRSLRSLGIRKLRLMARDKGLKSYSKYTKPQLLQFLQSA